MRSGIAEIDQRAVAHPFGDMTVEARHRRRACGAGGPRVGGCGSGGLDPKNFFRANICKKLIALAGPHPPHHGGGALEHRRLEIDLAWKKYTHGGPRLPAPAARRQLVQKHTERDGLCYYCEQPAWIAPLKGPNPYSEEYASNRRRAKTRATREHLVRKADGGTDADSNIVMACAACNHERQDTAVEAWKHFVMSRPTTINCS
jgi:hypothetical protein